MTKQKVHHTKSTEHDLFAVKNQPFRQSLADGFSFSHFLTTLILVTAYTVLAVLLFFERETLDSWFCCVSSPVLVGWRPYCFCPVTCDQG